MYVEEGLLNWDDKIHDFIPEFGLKNENGGTQVHIGTCAFPNYGCRLPMHIQVPIESGWTLDEIIPKFKEVNLAGEPGTIYSYQNAIYSLSGTVIERKAGIPLDSIYQLKIFDALGMDDASVTYEQMENSENRATPHIFRKYWKPTQITEKILQCYSCRWCQC